MPIIPGPPVECGLSARMCSADLALDAYCGRAAELAAMDATRRAIVRAAPTLCPHCGTAPADADGHACDYCRGYAYR